MIPYNPSSFNTNKTILEQILELKKWLKEHPSYAVYTTYIHYKPAENVDYFFTEINGDPDFVDNIAVGDLLWFGDGYISPIASITIDPNDRENSYVTISQPVTSLIGPTGPQGPRGYDGVSVTNASVNASGYLIITLSNGLTVNTGYVVGPQGPAGPTGATGPQGPTGPTGVSITNVAIDGNQHLIVTLSDGSSIDAGSVSSGVVELEIPYSQIGSALSDSDYAQVQNADIVIVNYGNGDLLEYTRDSETSTEIKFARMYGNGIDTIVVNKSTKVVTNPTNKLLASGLSSGSATSGQVLQADGNGGASWQNAGGGSTLYNHVIQLVKGSDLDATCTIISNVASFTLASFITYIKNKGAISPSRTFMANGFVKVSGTFYDIVGLYRYSGDDLGICYFNGSQLLGYGLSGAVISDTAYQL